MEPLQWIASSRAVLKRIWIVVAYAAIVVGWLPLASNLWWPFELFSHFRLQYLSGAVALMLPAILYRRQLIPLLLLATAGVNALPLLPYLPTADTMETGEPQTGRRIRILHLNVRTANLDHDRIAEVIQASGADVVSIVELSPELDRALERLAEYPHRVTYPAYENMGIGVLSRYPLEAPTIFELGMMPAIDTGITLPAGRLSIFAVHLWPPMSRNWAMARKSQLDALAIRANDVDGPLVICGDFNLSPYSPHFDRFLAASGTSDPRRGRGFDISWPTFLPAAGIPIDHCLTRGPFTIESVERLPDLGSDHYPVLITLWLGSGA